MDPHTPLSKVEEEAASVAGSKSPLGSGGSGDSEHDDEDGDSDAEGGPREAKVSEKGEPGSAPPVSNRQARRDRSAAAAKARQIPPAGGGATGIFQGRDADRWKGTKPPEGPPHAQKTSRGLTGGAD